MTWLPSIAAAVVITWAILSSLAEERSERRPAARLKRARTMGDAEMGDVYAVLLAEATVYGAWLDMNSRP
ncbi:hypothetical protein ABZ619_39260 [Streptomyces sp. NPDC007851]|uniref:hypothetical protein n=1 Tax=Streptomyces sp. NPDC007851 TaxID=3155008 RepID=UPI003404FEBC